MPSKATALAALLGLAAAADDELRYDTRAVQRSHVPHLNSSGGGGGGSGGGSPSPSSFSSSGQYQIVSRATPTSSRPEAEEHVAVDPSNSNNLIAAISDFSLRGGSNTTKYAFSSDNGSTWNESFVPLDASGSPITADGVSWPYNSDPVLAIDKSGYVYLADLYFNSSSSNNSNGLYVSVGTITGRGSFTAASTIGVAVNPDPATNVSEDKSWIAVDQSATPTSGTVYASWTRFVGNSDWIVFSRSTDHGQTWSTPIQISPPGQNGAVQGSGIAVGPAGEVYIVYEVFYVGGTRAQWLAKSTNGGATFGPAIQISPYFSELSFNSTYRKNSFASIAVAPSGAVCILYSTQIKRQGAELRFIQSTNGGASFSAPLTINDSTVGQHFMQALTTDSAGTIHASWFDTRLGGTSSVYDIFATRSQDGGATWAVNTRVTAASINAGNSSFIGDYSGIGAGGGFAHPVWTNGGFNGGTLQTAALK